MELESQNKLKKNSFTVPENYFSRIEPEILIKVRKKNSFKTPELYFQKLENDILNQTIEKKSKKKGKIIQLSKIYWAAACLLFLVSVGYFLTHTSITEKIARKTDKNSKEIQASENKKQSHTGEEYVGIKKPLSQDIHSVSHKMINKQNIPSSAYNNNKSVEVIYDLYFEEQGAGTDPEDIDIAFYTQL